jgi:hypothetical protein
MAERESRTGREPVAEEDDFIDLRKDPVIDLTGQGADPDDEADLAPRSRSSKNLKGAREDADQTDVVSEGVLSDAQLDEVLMWADQAGYEHGVGLPLRKNVLAKVREDVRVAVRESQEKSRRS